MCAEISAHLYSFWTELKKAFLLNEIRFSRLFVKVKAYIYEYCVLRFL